MKRFLLTCTLMGTMIITAFGAHAEEASGPGWMKPEVEFLRLDSNEQVDLDQIRCLTSGSR